MPTFIKTGYWKKIKKGLDGYLDLDLFIGDKITEANAITKPYKSYTVIVTQTSTNDPVVTVLQNDFTGTLSWGRTGVGIYTLISSGAEFTQDKTLPGAIQIAYDVDGNKLTAEWTSSSVITIKTYNDSDVATDAILSNTPIYIETYN